MNNKFNVFKAFYLSTALFANSMAATITPEDISKNMRSHLSGGPKLEMDKVADAIGKTTTWADSFIRLAIELCLQSLNIDKEKQAEVLKSGNEIFADMIKASAPKVESP